MGSGPSSSMVGAPVGSAEANARQHQLALLESLQTAAAVAPQTANPGQSPTVAMASSTAAGRESVTTPSAGTGSTNEVKESLQEANAMLSRLAKINMLRMSVDESLLSLSGTIAAMRDEVDNRAALLDSGASHVLRSSKGNEYSEGVPVQVELANGQKIVLHQSAGGSLLLDAQHGEVQHPILPLGLLVQELGCELHWSRRQGLRIEHPVHGVLKTFTRGPFPMLIESQALELIAQLEEKNVEKLRQQTVQTACALIATEQTPSFTWELRRYVQEGERAGAAKALMHPSCPLGTLSETEIGLIAQEVDASDAAGWKRLKALPVNRATRKMMMCKRWVVRVCGSGQVTDYKILEDNNVIYIDFSVDRSKFFSLKGDSPAYRALLWAAMRGQLEGILGWPSMNNEVFSKVQWIWLVAKQAAMNLALRRPFLALGGSSSSSLWKEDSWVRFEEELGVPLSQLDLSDSGDSFVLATNLVLEGLKEAMLEGEVGPGGKARSFPTSWPTSIHQVLLQGALDWKREPGKLEIARMLQRFEGPLSSMSEPELRRWQRHIRDGHRCRTCVRSSATGRSHRRIVAPSCYALSLDIAGPFREKGEFGENKGFRYVLVGSYILPRLEGYRDAPVAPDETGEDGPESEEDDGAGVNLGDIFEDVEEKRERLLPEDEKECDQDEARFKELFKEIGDTMEYQTVYYAVPLKSRSTREVLAGVQQIYLQLRAEGLPVVRVHSDRAREMTSSVMRTWLRQHDILQTTGEAQQPQSNGKAEAAVKILKRRAKAALFGSDLPVSCWPYAFTFVAWQQRELALGRKPPPAPFGAPVEVRRRVWYGRGWTDLESKWETGKCVGPSPDLRNGHVVWFKEGKFTLTSHIRAALWTLLKWQRRWKGGGGLVNHDLILYLKKLHFVDGCEPNHLLR